MRPTLPLHLALLGLALCVSSCSPASRPAPSGSPSVQTPAPARGQGSEPGTASEGVEMADEPRRTRRLLSQVVRNMEFGLEGLSPSTLLENIDRDNFFDYPRFEEGVTRFLESLGEMRVFIREADAEIGDGRATLVVDARLSFVDRLNPGIRGERAERLLFYFQRSEDGWRIIEIQPRGFFLP